ncbi:DUF6388 family protein [Pseudomonas sp. NPDC090202]|uniref:DUF6388 family protein n=1 Tax=Pseudomonas sp. NPDC090202 TaxID=3364476 RepID=UPI00380A7A2C
MTQMNPYENPTAESLKVEKRYNAARERFFKENRDARDELESLNTVECEHLGCSVEEALEQLRSEVFARAAKTHGLEIDEFVIRLTAESPEQARAWRLERHRHVADTLGIDWDTYKTLNAIIE